MKISYKLLLMLAPLILFGCSSTAQNTSQEIAATQNVNTTATPSPAPSPATSPNEGKYSKNLDELRSAFNRDKGKVRLLTLLSPT